MKSITKFVIVAILSLSIGATVASPLLVSELDIIPFIKTIPGTTATFGVNAVYANFTVINASAPAIQNSGPDIAYSIVLNVTNFSDLSAQLLDINFVSAEKITNGSSMDMLQPSVTGEGCIVEGVWLDGKWYNVTWVDGSWPSIDSAGKLVSTPRSSANGRWMEGAQLEKVYVNDTLTAIYMNMNGTWVDVTGRITLPYITTNSYTNISIGTTVIQEHHLFVSPISNNITAIQTSYPLNSTVMDANMTPTVQIFGFTNKYTWVGDGFFNNTWAPHQSRLILLSGILEVRQPYTYTINALDVLKTGNLSLATQIMDYVDNIKLVNNTFTDTMAYAEEFKQIQLTQIGDSYIYNNLLSGNQTLQPDQWASEVFVTEGP